jgi:multidrug efflux pump subunit AcrB
MKRIFTFFVDNWKFSFLLTVFVFILGFMSLGILQRESFPPVNFATVVVSSVYPGASPEEIHDKVTKTIEDELRGIEGIKDVRSISQNNSSSITIRIDIDNSQSTKVVADIEKAVQRARSRLPSEVTEDPVVMEINAKEIPVLELALVGDNQGRKRDIEAEQLKELLEDVNGVANVRYSGYQDKEIQVLLNRESLNKYGISLAEVFQSLSSQLKNIPSGFLDDKTNIALIRVVGKNTSLEEINNTIVRSNDVGTLIRIKDIGKAQLGSKRPSVLATVNGEEATLLVVTKKADADALKVLDKVDLELATFEKNLSKDLKLVNYNDEGKRIRNRLDIVNFNALTGMIIVIIILFVFLPGKIGLISSLSLPISALGTVGFMVFYGANFNIITMIALIICLGNLVDNSVVISEYYSQLREKGVEARTASIKAARQFWIPFTASTITIICAFLPMLVTKGVMGQFIMWIPIIVTIALTLSLLESVTLLPARLQFINPKMKTLESRSNGLSFFEKCEDYFEKMIRVSLKHRFKTLFALTALVISGIMVTAIFNRFELFPAEGVEYYVGRYKTEPTSSIFKTSEVSKEIQKEILKKIDKQVIEAVIGRAGIQQTDASDPRTKTGESVGLILVGIKPENAPDLDIQDTLKKLNSISKPVGVTYLNFEPIENGPPVGKPLTLTLRSTNSKELNELTDKFLNELRKLKGLSNVESDEEDSGKEYRFIFNDEKRSLSQVNTDLIGLNLRTALEGSVVQELTENGRQFDLVVRFEDEDKSNLNSIQKISILNNRGTQIPLLSLGKFVDSEPPKTIRNYNFKRSITITSDVDNVNLTSATANKEAEKILLKFLPQYNDVTYVVGGEEESTNESLQSLVIALVLAIFGIFATLVFTFRSFSSPFLILSTIPLGLVGVFYSFTAVGRPLSFLAFIGVVGLTGVVINSAIILVDYINELKNEMKETSLFEVLVLASKRRLRAVLATGLTTVVGLIPTAFGWGGYDAILVDITLALSWGMIIGTVLSLFWIPSGYSLLSSFRSFLLEKLKFNKTV